MNNSDGCVGSSVLGKVHSHVFGSVDGGINSLSGVLLGDLSSVFGNIGRHILEGSGVSGHVLEGCGIFRSISGGVCR